MCGIISEARHLVQDSNDNSNIDYNNKDVPMILPAYSINWHVRHYIADKRNKYLPILIELSDTPFALRSADVQQQQQQLINTIFSNELFPFCVDFFPLSPTRHLPDLIIWVTRWVSYKKHELLALREHLGSSCCSSFWFSVLCLTV